VSGWTLTIARSAGRAAFTSVLMSPEETAAQLASERSILREAAEASLDHGKIPAPEDVRFVDLPRAPAGVKRNSSISRHNDQPLGEGAVK
jgi:hypothetical protein